MRSSVGPGPVVTSSDKWGENSVDRCDTKCRHASKQSYRPVESVISRPCTGLLLYAMLMIAFASGCEDPSTSAEQAWNDEDPIEAAIAQRSDDDRARDATRRPAEVLALAGIVPGMQIADLMAGGGWYTEVLARAVGPKGRVYSHNNAISKQRYGSLLRQRLRNSALSNVYPVSLELDQLEFPASSLDAAFLVQFYHDTYWMGVNRAAMNRAVFSSLKPGGVFLIIDHSAKADSGPRDVETLHRVDEEIVEKELLSAGFELVRKSDLLRNNRDNRSESVFDDSIRGKTDRFLLVFKRPAA